MATAAVTFDLVSQSYKRDPFPTYLRMHAEAPVSRTKVPLVGEAWLVSGYDDVLSLLKDKDRFVHDPKNAGRARRAGLAWWMPRFVRVLTDHMLGMDEPDHRRLRRLVDKAFGRRGIEGMRPRIESITDAVLDGLDSDGPVDLIAGFARPLPLTVICELLGLPREDRARFTSWVEAMTRSPNAWSIIRSFPAFLQMTRYLKRQFETRRRAPRDDLITALVEAEDGGDQFSEDELLAMVFLLLIAGHETTVHLLGSGALALMETPDQYDRLAGDWSLIGPAVEELLRYTSPVEFASVRYAVADTQLGGQILRRGEPILPALGAANCDPRQFTRPDRLDIARSPNNHVALGSGIHFCLGQQLARLEGRIAFERLFRRYPDMTPAVPWEETEWRGTLGLRGLSRLPVRLRG